MSHTPGWSGSFEPHFFVVSILSYFLINSKCDLQNAEIWYLKAIEIGEKLETAVPDLNSIYMRTGQLDKSITLSWSTIKLSNE